jgi:hypothetical protein
MRCLSFRQPWLDLLISGVKRVEVRRWNTRYRGPLLLHAASQVDQEAVERFVQDGKLSGEYVPKVGVILGRGTLHDTFRYAAADEFNRDALRHLNPDVSEQEFRGVFGGRLFGWVLTDVHALEEPVPLRGQLGLFDVPDELIQDELIHRNSPHQDKEFPCGDFDENHTGFESTYDGIRMCSFSKGRYDN